MDRNNTSCRIQRVERCDLTAVNRPWPFAVENEEAIDFHWDLRTSENPNFFNGRIQLLADYSVEGDTLRGAFLETGFKEFLYWRESGEPDAGVTDAFGSAVIWSSDNGVLLCRQRPGHINTGLFYLPGGFIDASDVAADGCIDLANSSAREVLEETGLGPDVIVRQPGFWLTFSGQQLSIGVEYQSHLTSPDLKDRVTAHLAIDPNSELAEVTLVHAMRDVDGVAMPPFASGLLSHLLARPPNS